MGFDEEKNHSLVNFFVFDTSRNFSEDEVSRGGEIIKLVDKIKIFFRNTKVSFSIIRWTLLETLK